MRKDGASPVSRFEDITVHLDTPSLLGDIDDKIEDEEAFLDQLMLEASPLLDTDFAVAAERARMAGPSPEDASEWERLQADAWAEADDDTPDKRCEITTSSPPQPVGFVHKLRLDLKGLEIAGTDKPDKGQHLQFRAEHPDVDVIWVPSTDLNPLSVSLRVISRRSLLDHFTLIRSIPIFGRSRPPHTT